MKKEPFKIEDLLHEFFNNESNSCQLADCDQSFLEKEFARWAKEKFSKFENAAMPLIQYLGEQKHPHHAVVVTSTNAELFEGKCSTGFIEDFIQD
jgi:hypothetical protein